MLAVKVTPESGAGTVSCGKGQELKFHLKVVFGSLQAKEPLFLLTLNSNSDVS